jgi:hypothetical protein
MSVVDDIGSLELADSGMPRLGAEGTIPLSIEIV